MAHRDPHDDDLLVRRCLADDPDAWRELVDRHRPRLIELARRILPVWSAEDIVDAVITDLWQRRKLGRYEGRSSLRTWLGAVVINASLNARRRTAAGRLADTRAERDRALVSVPDETGGRALGEVLRDAIGSLPPPTRLMVLMHYEQGLTLDQVGAIVGASKSTVSRSLRDARNEIRKVAERLARERFGATLESLREGADLARLDLDLQAARAAARNSTVPDVSN